jgi:uridine phosphorylase
MEVLVALGVRRFLSIGSAGGLDSSCTPGDVVVLTGAVRDEGTSFHYVAPETAVSPDMTLTEDLATALARSDIATTRGSTWTTDAPYRQTAEEISALRERGVLVVEMEASALFALASVRAVPIASAVVIDSVFGEPIGSPQIDTAAAFKRLYDVFLVGIEVLAAA